MSVAHSIFLLYSTSMDNSPHYTDIICFISRYPTRLGAQGRQEECVPVPGERLYPMLSILQNAYQRNETVI